MNLALLGATGQVGSSLVAEALSHGHRVTGIARYPDAVPQQPGLTLIKADIRDYRRLPAILDGHEAVVSAVPFLAIDPAAFITAVKQAGAPRLLVVGGAGSLEIAPGKHLVDTPDFPADYQAEARAGLDFLQTLREERELAWTFLSPSAFLHPGPRTGRFRLGKDELLIDGRGESHISLADYAIAFIDELENPSHLRTRFTVGY